MNVENQPLVEPSKILLPSMHLKLGLMKNVVKAMDQEEVVFTYLQEKFPRLSEAKLKENHKKNNNNFTEMKFHSCIIDESAMSAECKSVIYFFHLVL